MSRKDEINLSSQVVDSCGSYISADHTHQNFPEGLVDTASQLSWSLTQIREQGQQLLAEAGYPDEVASLDQEMVGAALEAVMAHLEKEGDLRSKAIEQGLIVP